MASAAASAPYILRGSGSTGNVYQIRKDIEDIVIAECPALQNFRRQQPNTRILFKVMENKDAYTEYSEYTEALAEVYDPSYGVSLIICICNATQLINSLNLNPATHKALILVDSGMSLYDYLNTNQNRLTLPQLQYLISQFHRIIAVLTSLQHNDIKIQNIVVQINAENKATPFIIDFGLTGDIQDNLLNSLSYPAWSLEIGAFILKTTKYPPSATNK
jgi:serine/threonine protein kinase